MARVALMPGGTRGIGAAISKALKAAGYKVAASYAGNDAAAEKFKAETGIPVYKWDVSSFEACAAGVKKVEADLGPVDVLVNNAGITKDTAFHKMTLEQWNTVINTNLGSLFNMTRQVIEGMRARKFGRVINISSVNGQKGQFGQVNYSAAKAGDIGFTKALALENAKGGITVNVICPGYINTEMVLAVLTVATGKIPAFQLAAMTFAIGAVVGFLTWIRRPDAISALRQPPVAWVVGVGGLFGYHALYFLALRFAPPAEAGLLNYLWPLLIVLFSSLLPGELLAVHHVIGALAGLIGTVLLFAGGNRSGFEAEQLPGLLAAFVAAFVWAIYSVMSRRLKSVPTDAVVGFCLATAL